MQAAILRGTVVDSQSRHPLARSLVVVDPSPGSSGTKAATRTNANGNFEFADLAAGSYVVTVSRRAFATVQYGQKRWRGSGYPIALNDGDTASITVALPRFGVVTGALVDENDVGLPDHEVAIYRNIRPPVALAKAKTDDRGMYRFSGLEPGTYLVRSLTKSDEEGTFLPTFSRDVAEVQGAQPVRVALDQQIDNVNIRPAGGRLFTLSGRATLVPRTMGTTVTVSRSSDTGTERGGASGAGDFRFQASAPGAYELLATATVGGMTYADYQEVVLDHDTDMRLTLRPLPSVQFVVEDAEGRPVDGNKAQLMVRYKNLAGEAAAEMLRPGAAEINVLPGRWDVALAPNSLYYAAAITGISRPARDGRVEGWNEIRLTPGSQNIVKLTLSAVPFTLRGTVRGANGAPANGAKVFLEPLSLEPGRRLSEVISASTDAKGQYRFQGLAPGVYRVLGTADYLTADTVVMEASKALPVKLEETRDVVQDLELYVIR